MVAVAGVAVAGRLAVAAASTGKRYNLAFGVQAMNLFNNVDLSSPSGTLTSQRFGQSTQFAGRPFTSNSATATDFVADVVQLLDEFELKTATTKGAERIRFRLRSFAVCLCYVVEDLVRFDPVVEVFLEGLPAGVVLVLAGGGVHGEFGGAADEAGLEHEGQGAVELDGLQFGGAGAFEGFGVGAVAGHAVVQAGSAGNEAFGLGVVLAVDEAHELVHEVAVEPGWAEGVLGDDPAWGEDGEVDVGGAGDLAGRGEDGVDGGVGVVEGDGVDAVEAGEVVFAGGVVAVPGDDVEWGVVEVGGPEIALEFGDDLEGARCRGRRRRRGG